MSDADTRPGWFSSDLKLKLPQQHLGIADLIDPANSSPSCPRDAT
ncbi:MULTISPECIES: hypothetical protein [unclassified Burkholderia]|nr:MULTISPECIES: hypothetical protein [unclassified Burkholderia]